MVEDDLTSVDLLDQADEIFQKRDFDAALSKYEEAASAAYDEFNRSVETEALSQIARCHLSQGRVDDGKGYLAKAAIRAHEDDVMGWSRFLGVRGRFEWKDGKNDVARATFEALYEFCQLNDLWGRSVDAANMMSIVAESTDEQIEWSRKGIKAAQDGEQEQWLGPLWNNLGATYFDTKQYETALVCFEQAREYHWHYSDEVAKLFADYHVGMTLRHLNRFDEAAVWLRPVLAWAERLDNKVAIAQASEDLGETMIGQGKPADGLTLLKRAIEFYDLSGWRNSNPETVTALEKRVAELQANVE